MCYASPLTPLLQEYFYKSQDSLATVIDFVDQKVEGQKEQEPVPDSAPAPWSSHSSPLMPASRRVAAPSPRRQLTP